MVSVVPFLQLPVGLLHAQTVRFGQPPHAFREDRTELLLRDAAEALVGLQHGDVPEVVQVTEHAHLAELRHAGKQGEADILVAAFQNAVKRLQRTAVVVLQRPVADGLQKRLVIFVHQNYHATAARPACLPDQVGEPLFGGAVFLLVPVH